MMDKQSVIHPHNGILCSLKKEGNSDTTWMDPEDMMFSEQRVGAGRQGLGGKGRVHV